MNKKAGKQVTDLDRKEHWEHIYSDKKSTEVSWYQQHPEISLELIKSTGVEKSARIIDIGGGASTLVDYLLSTGYENISVLDISRSAIEQAKQRLGEHENRIQWLEKDITTYVAKQKFDLWHDRAVFHFLTDAEDRLSYVKTISSSLRSGAHAIIATFNIDGPEKCSGLEIVRYSPESLSAVFSENFQLLETRIEEHKTPGGATQSFVYCRFVKT